LTRRSSHTAVSSQSAIFERLVGLETEYALRYRPTGGDGTRPSRFGLFRTLVAAVRQHVLTVRARHFKEGIFTANGGAVWFEAERVAAGGGLVEGSTPECRGPRQVLLYQRAQDEMLARSAGEAQAKGQLSLIKNCRDCRDNVYGAQENYEADVASGWQLGAWRLGLVLLLPLVVLTWFGYLLLILAVLGYLAAASLLYLPLAFLVRRRREVALALFGKDLIEGRETGVPLPAWLESLLLWAARIVSAPLALTLFVLISAVAFRRIRRLLEAFLVSRPLVAGSGMIDRQQRFHLSDKAPAINCVLGYGGYWHDRPLFNFGHFFKTMSIEAFVSPRDYADLFARRQRLQIGLGDSNMADVAEFLRVGTTLLVLDAIEAGALPQTPRVRRPIRALHAICADPSLTVTLPLRGGGRASAWQLQAYYLAACQRFLTQHPDPPAEAQEVVRRWAATLHALRHDPQSLIGSLDWVTKKYLLDESGRGANWAELKKIDIRYHELSDEGYYRRLRQTGICPAWVDVEKIAQAMRAAPPDSPATTRGHYIREFAGGDLSVSANWKRVIIGRGRSAKVIHLRRYRSKASGDDAERDAWPLRG
jgi:Pup amidohydrolase